MLKIEIIKKPDGTGILRCTRQDGSLTWQKQAKHSRHFVLHDLTHFAVETCLGCQQGFFGLIDAGWDVEDTTGHGVRGHLPRETIEVERIVGLFDAERASNAIWTSEEFQAHSPRALTEADIQSVRSLRSALFRQWHATLPGETLKLTFELTTVPSP